MWAPCCCAGNLYLANVQPEDLSEDGEKTAYMCVVQNRFLQSLVQGTEISVQLVQQPGKPNEVTLPMKRVFLMKCLEGNDTTTKKKMMMMVMKKKRRR